MSMSRGHTPSILAFLKEREALKKKFHLEQRKAVQAARENSRRANA